MNVKYRVAPRKTASKMLGMPGWLIALDLLAVTEMIENARKSVSRHGLREA